MIDTMKITVTTPTLTPRIVNAERSLLARNVSNAIRADSLMSSNRITQLLMLQSDPIPRPATRPTSRLRSRPPKKHQHLIPPKPHSRATEIRSAPRSHKRVQIQCPHRSVRRSQSPSPLRSKTASGCLCDSHQSPCEYRSLSCAQ